MPKFKKPNSFSTTFNKKSPFKQDSEIDEFVKMGSARATSEASDTTIVDPSKYYEAPKTKGDEDEDDSEENKDTSEVQTVKPMFSIFTGINSFSNLVKNSKLSTPKKTS